MRDVTLYPGANSRTDVILRLRTNQFAEVYLKPGWIVDTDPVLVTNRNYPGSLEAVEPPPAAASGRARMMMGVGM